MVEYSNWARHRGLSAHHQVPFTPHLSYASETEAPKTQPLLHPAMFSPQKFSAAQAPRRLEQ